MGQIIVGVEFGGVNYGGSILTIAPLVTISCINPVCHGQIRFVVGEEAKAERGNAKSPWGLKSTLRFLDYSLRPMIPDGSCSECGVKVAMTKDTQEELVRRIGEYVRGLNTS